MSRVLAYSCWNKELVDINPFEETNVSKLDPMLRQSIMGYKDQL